MGSTGFCTASTAGATASAFGTTFGTASTAFAGRRQCLLLGTASTAFGGTAACIFGLGGKGTLALHGAFQGLGVWGAGSRV